MVARHDRDSSRKDKGDFIEHVISINRVAKVVKGGRRFSFNALVAVGNGSGKVGVGLGKANEIAEAIRKASETAKRSQIEVPMVGTSIPYKVLGRYGAGRVLLKPCAPGTGVIAGGPVRAILESAGVADILTKALGTNNPHNVVKATMAALGQLQSAKQVAARRGISLQQMFALPDRPATPVAPEPEPAAAAGDATGGEGA